MTVRELIVELENIPMHERDRIVVMSRDSEGNGYSLLAQADLECAYLAETTWHGELVCDEDEDVEPGVPAVCFWPTN